MGADFLWRGVRIMAGDWIKLEHWTPDKPEVFRIADILSIDPDAVTGKLIRIWIWADQQTTDGNAVSVTKALLDRITSVTGFANAMISVGWLEQVSDGVRFANFDRHNGCTAKKRAQTSKRVEKSRGKSVTQMKRRCNAESVTREEKNRKENTSAVASVIEKDDIAERIYAAYPRKVAKPAALKAIRKALESIDGESLLALVEAYSEARRGQDQQYTPHPATWFNGQRWADDPATWRTDDKRQPDLFGGIRDWLEESDGN